MGGLLPGILNQVYEENRYLVAQVQNAMSDGNRGPGLVLVSGAGAGHWRDSVSNYPDVYICGPHCADDGDMLSIFSQNLCRPLKAMANAARNLATETLKARGRISQTIPRKIDELAVAFNNMASSLEQSEYQRQEFVANVSHELKTPMTTIGGYVDGILTAPSRRNGAEIPESGLQRNQASEPPGAKHAGRPASRIRASRRKNGALCSRVSGAGTHHLRAENQRQAPGCGSELPEYSVYAQGELDAITQVAYNLIDNAVKFCPPGGQLGLSLRESGSKVYVSVSNTGDTIPQRSSLWSF